MSSYGPTFHSTPVDLCIIFQCNLYISCIMSSGIKIVSNWFKLFQYLFSRFRICRGAYVGLAERSPGAIIHTSRGDAEERI